MSARHEELRAEEPRTGVRPAEHAASERRGAPRWTPASEWPVTLVVGEARLSGAALDVSRGGARLRLAGPRPPALRPGVEGLLEVRLGPELHQRRVRIAWLVPQGEGELLVGVENLDAGPGEARDLELDLSNVRIDPAWALRVPASLALRRRVLPLCALGEHVIVAVADPGDVAALAAVRRHIDRPLLAQQAEPRALLAAIRRVHGEPRATAAEPAPDDAVSLADELLHAAWLRQASDIHVCPQQDGVLVRLRVDGQLEDYRRLPVEQHAELLSRLKVLAGMDIAERRAPQDGRFTHRTGDGARVDIRAATLPTNHGERATLRLLAIGQESLTLEHLGLLPDDLALLQREMARPHGLLLATGPTGCGKTTTLHAALRRIVTRRQVNAIAVQEPVEYDIPGVTQVEVDSQKITFASALRSILRHDPDVILIGEIRDRETADIAIKSALTGHLVLATLHTNSAASAVTRLLDMGVESFLLAATLRGVIAQRLVRRLCPHCRRSVKLSAAEALAAGLPEAARDATCAPRGCVWCAGRGYAGRSGLFEVLVADEELASGVLARSDEASLAQGARRRGARNLRDDAARKLLEGTTSFEEVMTALQAVPDSDGSRA